MLRIYFLLSLFILVSCRREDSDITQPIEVITEETETYFDSNFIGKTTDENGQALEGVKVIIGEDYDISTKNGIFLFNQTKTNGAGSLVYLSKSGYFDQYLFVAKAANEFSNHVPKLKKKADAMSFDGSSAVDLVINNDINLSIPMAAFADINGNIYNGQIRLFTHFEAVHGNMPVIDINLRKGIFSESTNVLFVFETSDGRALKIVKPLTLITGGTDMKIGKMDVQKEKWVELQGSTIGNTVRALMDQGLPYIIGKIKPVTRVNTQIVSESNDGVAFTSLDIKYDLNETWSVTPDQNGHVSFYAPAQTSVSLFVKDICGNIMVDKSVSVGDASVQDLANIVLKDSDLLVIESKIDPCGLPLSKDDLVHVQLKGDNKNVLAYQSQNSQTYVMPSCLMVDKATYFRGKEEKFSISFSGLVSNQRLNINAAPLCIEKISGYFSVNDVPVLLDMNEYYIYREIQNLQNVVISDLNGFMISVPAVTGKGKYKPDAVFFNHPSITDCVLEECREMMVWIDEISTPGAVVKIRVEGTMNGKKVKGELVHLLR